MIITGKLIYNDGGCYEIHNNEGVFYLTNALDEAYYSRNGQVFLQITGSGNGNSLLFNENSTIYKRKNDYEIYSYFICGADLETVLFNNTDRIINVIMKSKNGEQYGQFYEAKEE